MDYKLERGVVSLKEYFKRRMLSVTTSGISPDQIEAYRELVLIEMRKMGATEDELLLIHETTILNSILNERKPGDVAWAILQ